MTFQRNRYFLFIPAVMLVCGLQAGQVYEVRGVIRGKLPDGRPVIEHEAIPGYMMAMTMAFNVADAGEVERFLPGDQVSFRFHVEGQRSWAEGFARTGKEAPGPLPVFASGGTGVLKTGGKVPPFNLVNEKGEPFTEKDLLGNFTVLTFMFTRCPVPEFCPLLATKFQILQTAVLESGEEDPAIRLLSISLDPGFDRPSVLLDYGKRVGANAKVWGFLTGEAMEVRRLARAFEVGYQANAGILDHTLTTALIGPDGWLENHWPGNRWQAAEVLAAIREAADRFRCQRTAYSEEIMDFSNCR